MFRIKNSPNCLMQMKAVHSFYGTCGQDALISNHNHKFKIDFHLYVLENKVKKKTTSEKRLFKPRQVVASSVAHQSSAVN